MTYNNIIEMKKFREEEIQRAVRSTARKRYRIKSTFKFATFIAIIGAIIFFSALTVINADFAIADSKDSYITYVVKPGDTLWEIATSEMDANVDVRKSVYIIEETNKISSADLKPGMELIIPIR